jgi:hypothetical protein
MNKTVKVLIIFGILLLAGLVCCSGAAYYLVSTATPVPVVQVVEPTVVPVQPTYIPYPTYTPLPPLPTEKPIEVVQSSGAIILIEDNSVYKGSGPDRVDCPDKQLPSGATKMDCYFVSTSGMGVVYLDNNNDLRYIAIGIPISGGDDAYDCGVFAAQVADEYGWNVDDLIGALDLLDSSDVVYTYKSISIRGTMSDDGLYMYIMFAPSNSDAFQG